MTVRELIEKLENFNGNMLIVMSSDEEGNEFNPMSDDVEEYYYSDREIYSDEDIEDMELDDDEKSSYEKVVVLWP